MLFLPQNKYSGFTLIEVMIITPIVLITIAVFVSALIAMSSEVAKTQVDNNMVYNVQDALNTVERDARLSANFLAGNEFAVPAPLGYSDGSGAINSFTNNGTNGEMLILRGISTDRNPLNPSRQLIYKSANGCAEEQKIVSNFYHINIIYFLKNDGAGGKSLWRRVLAPSVATCSTPWQKSSCNPTVSKSTTCFVDDMRMVDNVESFTVDYYYSAADSTPVADAKSTAIAVADRNVTLRTISSVKVTIATKRSVAGKEVSHSGAIVTSRMNIPYEAVGTP